MTTAALAGLLMIVVAVAFNAAFALLAARFDGAVARAAASAETTARLQELTQRILADVERWAGAPADLVDLHERLNGQWRCWRDVREL